MIQRFILLSFLLILQHFSQAQSNETIVDPKHVDLTYIRLSAISTLDSIRKVNNASIFVEDQTLDSLANQQAMRLAGQPIRIKISTLQLPKGKRFDKLKENAAYITIHQPENDFRPISAYYHINTTYHQTVNAIVQKLLTTNRQYKKILQPLYTCMGFAVQYNENTNELSAVLIIARGISSLPVPLQLPKTPSGESVVFPSKRIKYPFRIGAPKRDNNQKKISRWSRRVRRYQDGRLVTSFKLGKKTFRRWTHKTGLAYESKLIDSYSSEQKFNASQSRLNQRSILNENAIGFTNAMTLVQNARETYFSIYGKKWIKFFKIIPTPFHYPPSKFIINASLPYSDSTCVDNILILRKGRITDIIPIQPLPGNFIEVPYPLLPYPTFAENELQKKVIYTHDTIRLQVNYSRGEILPVEDDANEIIRRIPFNRKVIKINIAAFASIEGSAERNTSLFQKRSNIIKDMLSKEGLLSNEAVLETKTMENWDVFDRQVSNSSLAWLQHKTHDEIRTYINNHLKDTIVNDWLDEQRYSEIVLILKDSTSIPITADTIANIFNSVIRKVSFNPSDKDLHLLERLQTSFYSAISTQDSTRWRSLNIPSTKNFLGLRLNERLYQLKNAFISEDTLFYWVNQNGTQKGLRSGIRNRLAYCNQIYIANHFFNCHNLRNEDFYIYPSYRREMLQLIKQKKLMKDEPDLASLDYILSESAISYILKQLKQKKDLQHYMSLRLFHLVTYVQNQTEDPSTDPRTRNSLYEIWNTHIQKETLTDERRIAWAMFFTLYERPEWALNLLKPLIERSEPDHFALAFTLSIEASLYGNKKIEAKIMDAAGVLTDKEWCSMLVSGYFLPATLLESYPLRKKYQEKLMTLKKAN